MDPMDSCGMIEDHGNAEIGCVPRHPVEYPVHQGIQDRPCLLGRVHV